jgi:short-subunit dehydrogenase
MREVAAPGLKHLAAMRHVKIVRRSGKNFKAFWRRCCPVERRSTAHRMSTVVRDMACFSQRLLSFRRIFPMNVQLKPLSEQVIVLTGATSGIGLATARKAARRGAKLVLVARNKEALRQVSDDLVGHGAEVHYIAADVANEDDVRGIAESAIQRFGGFDAWFNIAGVTIFGKNEDVSIEDMRRLFDINFWGVVYGSLAAVQHLKSRGGALINMGSESSDHAIPLQGIYSASKQAIKGFTDSLRIELEEQGAPISVTLVKPSSIDTMLVSHAKNYLEVEPRLPPPIYSPEIAADALLYAAEHPMRDVYVGGRARLLASASHYMPGMVDRGMKRFIYKFTKTDKPARDRDQNNLHKHTTDLLERGGIEGYKSNTSLYTSAVTNPAATKAAAMLGAGLALAALWRARRRSRAAS